VGLEVFFPKTMAVMLHKDFSLGTYPQVHRSLPQTAREESGRGSEILVTVEQLFSNLIREQAKVHVLIAVILDPNLLIDTLIREM
jgi:hypothetical protein